MLRKTGGMLALTILTASCGAGNVGEPTYSLNQCRHVAVTDAFTGTLIKGAEDLALDAKNNRLIVSAYDRRAVEKSSKKPGVKIPQGGIYQIAVSDLFGDEPISATPIINADDVEGGLRPHGMDYNAASGDISFINRTFEIYNGRQIMKPRLFRITSKGIENERIVHCASNDIATNSANTFLSFDHRECGFKATVEDVLAQGKSGLQIIGGNTIANSVRFANGVANSGDDILLAATLENSIRVYRDRGRALMHVDSYPTPGSPDNLSVKEDGLIIAALHPSLGRLALNRKLGIGRAPSRIVSVNPSNGLVTPLFEDKKGALFSAATVGIETDAGLIAGSVTDTGLLVCAAAE